MVRSNNVFRNLMIVWNKRWFLFLFCLAVSIALVYITALFIDPDFGWHIRTGQYEWQHGLPTQTLYTYTMPSYPYVDHEWLTNITMYLLWQYGGWWALVGVTLSIVFATVALLYTSSFSLLPIVLIVAIFIPRMGVRPQVIAWAYVAFLMWLLSRRDTRWQWIIPIVFVLWANTHGSYPYGLVLLIGSSVFQRRHSVHSLISGFGVLIASGLSTLVTPYWGRNWWEIYQTMRDSRLRWEIAEWQPFWIRPEPSFLFLATLFLILVWWRYRRNKLIVGMAGILVVFSASALRHVPLFAITVAPWVSVQLERVYEQVSTIRYGAQRYQLLYSFICWIASIFVVFELGNAIVTAHRWSEVHGYPQRAVEQLPHIQVGKLFTYYGWGGYLILHTEQPLFVDGRMPSYVWDAPAGELDDAFGAYLAIMRGENIDTYFSQFGIQTVMWPKAMSLLPLTRTNWLHQLEYLGFRVLYEDEVTVIYRRDDAWE